MKSSKIILKRSLDYDMYNAETKDFCCLQKSKYLIGITEHLNNGNRFLTRLTAVSLNDDKTLLIPVFCYYQDHAI
jgi:hypothetical protein